MSLNKPTAHKMMQTPPAQKEYLQEFHFAPTAEYYAEVVSAKNVQEAEATYHRVKRLINPIVSTASTAPKGDDEGVQ